MNRSTESATAPEIADITVIGAGKMARDIGLLCCDHKLRVTWLCSDPRIEDLSAFVQKKIRQSRGVLAENVSMHDCRVLPLEGAALPTPTIVIECCAEDPKTKRDALSTVCSRYSSRPPLIVSNSSSILPTELGADIIGMHFFFPTMLTRFAEIIIPPNIGESPLQLVEVLARRLMLHLVKQDLRNAFFVNRLLLPLQAEAVRLWLSGKDKDIIDAASASELISAGQFSLADEIGLDVLLSGIRRYVDRMPHHRRPDYTPLIDTLVAWTQASLLGKKNKRTIKRTEEKALRACPGLPLVTRPGPVVDDIAMSHHFHLLLLRTCLNFVEEAECDLSQASRAFLAVFGAQTSLDAALAREDGQKIVRYLSRMYEETGLSYFAPSRLAADR